MKKITTLLCTLLMTLSVLSAKMTNDSVIKMVSAGLADDTIIMAMQTEECEFDTSVDALIALKDANVSEAVIKAMIAGGEAPAVESKAAPVSKPKPKTKAVSVSNDKVIPPFIDPNPGNTYYTRFTFFYERNRYLTTNYARGVPVPINTEVELVSYGSDEMVLNIKGAMVKVKNVRKYTNASIEEFASLMLSSEPTKIDAYGSRMASDIKNGQLRLGMTKEQALMTRGYPPKHETPSVEADRWVYWSSRFVKRTIVFYNNVLSEGRGIN